MDSKTAYRMAEKLAEAGAEVHMDLNPDLNRLANLVCFLSALVFVQIVLLGLLLWRLS